MEVNQEVYERIDALANKLEVTAALLFAAMVKRAKAEAIIDGIYTVRAALMASIGSVAAWKLVHKTLEYMQPYSSSSMELCVPQGVWETCSQLHIQNHSDAQTFVLGVLAVVALTVSGTGFYGIWDSGTDAIRHAMAYEAEAAEDIVDLVRG